MSAATASWGSASEILAATGVTEDPDYYCGFTAEDEKAVLTVAMSIQEAWLRNDADLFADLFAENGSLLMKDDQLRSREEIRAYMAAGFAGPFRGAQVKGWPLSITFLDEDVSMVITEGGIIMAGEDVVASERRIRATWVISKRDGRPAVVSHQGSPVAG